MIDPIFVLLLFFAAWISYTDYKKHEIKNYSILALISAAVLVNVFITKTFIQFPLASSLNILEAAAAGIIIWIAGIWSAADAKLFIALNFLFPITLYQHYAGYFPGFFILINSSIPLFLFLFLQVIFKTNLKEKKEVFFAYLKMSFITRIILVSAAIYCISFYVSYVFRIRTEYLLWIMVLFLMFWFVEEKLKIKLTYFFVFVLLFSFLFALIFNLPLFTLSSLFFVLLFFLLIFFLFNILTLGIPLFTYSVKIANLREGMIPAEMIVKEEKGERFGKRPITFLNFLVLLRERARSKPVIGFNPDGLAEDEVGEIKSLYKKGLLKAEDLKISITIPFALVLFFGALLTYFSKGLFFNIF